MCDMARSTDIDKLRKRVGTFDEPVVDAPIGAVQLPATGVRYDRHGNPKPLLSGQDSHDDEPDEQVRAPRKRKHREPELAFQTDVFAEDPDRRRALTTCHKVLADKFVTEHQLRTKLVKAEHAPEAIEHAIERCRAGGLVDDVRYAEQWVESRARRGHGARRITQDLAQRGVDRTIIAAALEPANEAGALDAGAIDAARKKFARLDLADAKVRAKALRWLLGRGFTSSQAYAALGTIRAERDGAGDEA
ncbi:MAG: putative recombination regulator RecX [Thermoleophilia bacterium]|nr:putative recombination regulator RecX [Thermoleophilia bacterium]